MGERYVEWRESYNEVASNSVSKAQKKLDRSAFVTSMLKGTSFLPQSGNNYSPTKLPSPAVRQQVFPKHGLKVDKTLIASFGRRSKQQLYAA
jgi:hypothetical protein